MMAINYQLQRFERLADEVGATTALLLCMFFGGNRRAVFVPREPTDDHILGRLVGRRGFSDLCAVFGGETLQLPSLDDLEHIRAAGLIHALGKAGVSTNLISAACGLTPRRVQQVRAQLAREGLADLIDAAESDAAAALAADREVAHAA